MLRNPDSRVVKEESYNISCNSFCFVNLYIPTNMPIFVKTKIVDYGNKNFLFQS